MSEIEAGTLYDLNKNLVQQHEKSLGQGVINSKKEIIKNYLRKINNTYYMLLCNERKDYTVFRITDDEGVVGENQYIELINILVDECLVNRGEIRGIDLTKNQDAIEIWLLIEEEAYVYYFFPYDNAIIEV